MIPNNTKEGTFETKIDWIGETNIRIFNSNGGLMLKQTFQDQEKMDLDLRAMVPGMYFVEIRNELGREIKKIVIKQTK